MKHDIVVPAMGESISEATIGEILKPSGSAVSVDDEIVELETDKVNQVLYAPAAGVIQLQVSKGQVVKIGDKIGVVDTEGSVTFEKPVEKPPTPTHKEPPSDVSVRISKDDYITALKETKATPVPTPPQQEKPQEVIHTSPPAGKRRERRVPMSRIRQVIAKKMVEAQHQTAMLTTFNEIDMSTVIDLRARYKEEFVAKHGVKLGFMSFFVKAAVMALHAVPEIKASIVGDEILYRDYDDIGIAVGTDKGVFVPVVRDCDQKSFAQIEQEIVAYAIKGREGKLSLDDIAGGGFTITNGGVYGSLLSTPILNPPQSGILGMHKIQERPIAVDGQVVIRPMMYVALSYDHRIVDGKGAVSFLVKIKEILEDPSRIVLEV